MTVSAGRTDAVGLELPTFTSIAERGTLRFFARVIGQTDPVYSDLAAARDAGYTDLPIPPTFLFSLERAGLDPNRVLGELQIDTRQILHGEQEFVYHRVAVAGEELSFAPQITDDYQKRDGALRFLVRETSVTSRGAAVAHLRNVIVIRQTELR
ncbi:MaoC family dehydratase N-terminal domain-containing protein [Mycobacterium sp.]|jgi:hypothetical protein|uniref:MaoC family dehydratase N-terminal domain-containing protein n=1 Tax=Mycobacterium sp. TaxID=1785 RepID=UPI00262F6ADB|nr:MaoC family dehydratase N-terminal domain-containing protein [Mycobacterium sp.]